MDLLKSQYQIDNERVQYVQNQRVKATRSTEPRKYKRVSIVEPSIYDEFNRQKDGLFANKNSVSRNTKLPQTETAPTESKLLLPNITSGQNNDTSMYEKYNSIQPSSEFMSKKRLIPQNVLAKRKLSVSRIPSINITEHSRSKSRNKYIENMQPAGKNSEK